jgi:hypothetical protein
MFVQGLHRVHKAADKVNNAAKLDRMAEKGPPAAKASTRKRSGPERESKQQSTGLTGRRLLGVEARPDAVELIFDDGWSVEVDIRDEAYTGPEAMNLHRPGKPIVVWT